MSAENADLHGSAPDKCELALLIIDVINPLQFPEAEDLLQYALPMARELQQLKTLAQRHDVPVVYANDNFGRWQSDFTSQVDRCLREGMKGREIVEILRPSPTDYCVLKPKHSAFFSTTLDTLLKYLGTRQIVLTGMATNICVLFTANDAYMRDLELIVPEDCVAANSSEDSKYALRQMRDILKADTRPWQQSCRYRMTES